MFNLGWACVTKSLKYYYIGMEAEGGGGGGAVARKAWVKGGGRDFNRRLLTAARTKRLELS